MPEGVRSGTQSAEQLIQWSKSYWIETCFDRAEKLKPCPSGATGACCRICHMGPCRFLQSGEGKVEKGVCGATLATVIARNILRMTAAGAAAHSDQARDLTLTLLGVANGEIKDFKISDTKKLYKVAETLGIESDGRTANAIARDVAERLLGEFAKYKGTLRYINRAPKKTLERWEEWGIIPTGIDREIIEAMHRTNIGVDHEPDSLLMSTLRVSLAGGWGGAMVSADIADILLGAPQPFKAEAGLGIFRENEVNLIIHGHDPTLAGMIADVAAETDMLEYAKSKGAEGISLSSIFNIRPGINIAGGFTNQELCLTTGLIDAVAVDFQCIMPALIEVANNFHTKIITTSHKARFPGALHIQYDIHRAKDAAREIVRLAIDNYPNRTGNGERITEKFPAMAGFSHEYLEYMNGSALRASFRLLNDAIISGKIRGIAGLIGSDNPRVQAAGIHRYLAKELIGDDVLVLSTESASAACAVSGYLNPETALNKAGPGLRMACEEIGIPPILHLGGTVDNSRLLTILSAMAAEGGLSDEIGGMPVAVIAPEWLAEKELAAACCFAASGVPVILGGTSPVEASEEIAKMLSEVLFERFRGALNFETHFEKMFEMALNYIDKAREGLNLREYKYGEFDV